MKINKQNIISKKGGMSYLQILILIISTFAFAYMIYSATEVSAQTADYCCEKTNYGAWCQNTKQENCKEGFRKVPTSCDATSYCKEGCCYDSSEGLCMENTPQRVCNDKNGTWADSAECEIPQCNLGCCVLDNQAAFVTLTRCKKLSSLYGLATDFRTGVQDEVSCIAITQAQDKGACVYEEEFTRTCKFTTRESCKNIASTGNLTEPEFFKDYLCSAEELATNCGPSSETICVGGKDEVYFKDTCGNPANIYDASKIKEPSYWKKIMGKAESCGYGKDNAGSKDCGNCDYYLGSICKKAERGKSATYGENICKDLNCYKTSDGDKKHGESWCSYDGNTGKGSDAVGSRQVRHLCVAGEEILEPCADFRQENCIEGKTAIPSGSFQESACRVNRWKDCVKQEEKEDCENTDKRDCFWIEGVSFTRAKEANTEQSGGVIGLVYGGKGGCVPDVPPGLKFWAEEEAEGICKIASAQCIVVYEKGLFGSKKCIENCECLEESWAGKMNQVCAALGDCGAYVNYVGKFTDDGADWKIAKEKQTLSQNIVGQVKAKAGVKTTGKVVDTGNVGVNAFVVALAKGVSWMIGGMIVGGSATIGNVRYFEEEGNYYKEFLDSPGKVPIRQSQYVEALKTKASMLTAATTKQGTTVLSQMLGLKTGFGWDALVSGAQYAAMAYGIGQLAGGLFGMDKPQQKALSTALAAGAYTWKFLGTLKQGQIYDTLSKLKIGLTSHPGLWGIGVGIVVFALMYKKQSQEIVSFSCKPWQAPVGSTGGNDCEKCNLQEGCSEYRCKSLGQACQLLNVGTKQEKCAWVNPKDTSSPIITTWEDALTKGYKYEPDNTIRPPARGVKILKTNGGCVEAFTSLEFGITTNEPAQCKIDYNHTLKFDEMAFFFGESNLFLYNHSQKMSLPGPSAVNAAAPEIQDDGTYTLYARCQDANGNANVDEFAIRFCVDKGPDTTPPKIEGTSIGNEMPVKFNQSSVDLEVYVNEPSDCKWSREDRSYDNMENLMSCNKNVWEMNNNLVYTCKTTLTGIKDRQDNKFYFRCKDQPLANEPERNVMQQSYPFTLAGTETLNIIDIKPNGTIYGSTEVVSVWLEAETANGYKNGEAICYYSDTQNEADYVEFRETGTSLHKQRLDLTEGNYKYYVKCVDLGGNRDDNNTEFKVEVDNSAPAVARVYRENELLKVVTTEESECRYDIKSCNFKFEDGIDMPYANQTSHVAEWKTENTYYIRCSDKYGNIPLSNQCSIIVRPYDVVEQKEKK